MVKVWKSWYHLLRSQLYLLNVWGVESVNWSKNASLCWQQLQQTQRSFKISGWARVRKFPLRENEDWIKEIKSFAFPIGSRGAGRLCRAASQIVLWYYFLENSLAACRFEGDRFWWQAKTAFQLHSISCFSLYSFASSRRIFFDRHRISSWATDQVHRPLYWFFTWPFPLSYWLRTLIPSSELVLISEHNSITKTHSRLRNVLLPFGSARPANHF